MTLFLNRDPPTHWCGPENIVQVRVDGETSWDLLDNGSSINTVISEFVEACSLDVGPLNDLVNGLSGMVLADYFPDP